MYRFIPVICLAIFVAACSAPISQVAKDELAATKLDEGKLAQKMFTFMDANHDGTLVRVELSVIYPDTGIVAEKFATFDKDSDGDIEMEEFVDVYSAIFEDEAAQAIFYSMDVNHDGKIVKEELIVSYPDMVIFAEKFTTFDKDADGDIEKGEFVDVYSALDEDEAAQAMFYSLDVNHDGTVSKEELMVIYPDAVIVAEKYTIFDKDADGDIEKEEFIDAYSELNEGAAAQAMFYSLDVNHDGIVTREELMIIYPDMVIFAKSFTTFDKDGDGGIEIEEFVDIY